MLRALVLGVALVPLVGGCVHTQPVSLGSPGGRAAVNALAARKPAVLIVVGEPGRRVRALHVAADTTTWVDRRTGRPHAAPTADVAGVTFFRGRASALRGLAIGTGVGAVMGGLVGALDGEGWFTFSPTMGALLGAAGGAELGVIVGAGQQDRYVNVPSDMEVTARGAATGAPCGRPPRVCAASAGGLAATWMPSRPSAFSAGLADGATFPPPTHRIPRIR